MARVEGAWAKVHNVFFSGDNKVRETKGGYRTVGQINKATQEKWANIGKYGAIAGGATMPIGFAVSVIGAGIMLGGLFTGPLAPIIVGLGALVTVAGVGLLAGGTAAAATGIGMYAYNKPEESGK